MHVSCIFCDIVEGKRDAFVVYEDEYHLAFLDRYPVVRGHTLVIPKSHHYMITDMDPSMVGRLFSVVPSIARAVVGVSGADAFNLGQNNGHVAKQVVPHVHVHIIPRREGDHINWSSRKLLDGSAQEMADSIRAAVVQYGAYNP